MTLPRRELTALNPFFDFDRAFNRMQRSAQKVVTQPAMNLFESNEAYLILLDMPGVEKTKVDVSWQDNILTVKAERSCDLPESFKALRQEIATQPYQRKLEFSTDVDAAAISASYNEGILSISVPKKAEEIQQPQRIIIQ